MAASVDVHREYTLSCGKNDVKLSRCLNSSVRAFKREILLFFLTKLVLTIRRSATDA